MYDFIFVFTIPNQANIIIILVVSMMFIGIIKVSILTYHLHDLEEDAMRDGFIKVAAATTDIRVGDVPYNVEQIVKEIRRLEAEKVKCAVFPELCMTGYTCGDLFLQDVLLRGALRGLNAVTEQTNGMDIMVIVGLPMMHHARLYNVAAVIQNGELLGLVPKTNIPSYSEFYEGRHFAAAGEDIDYIKVPGMGEEYIPFSSKLLFQSVEIPEFVLGIDICEDLWMPIPPSSYHAKASATVIANLSASDETTGKDFYRRELVKSQSGRLVCAYLYADAGEGESSTDLVFAGHNIIAENGSILGETKRFTNGTVITEIDLGRLVSERRRITTYPVTDPEDAGYDVVEFHWGKIEKTNLTRHYARTPFVPNNKADRDFRCDEILNIQAMGLKKRLQHTGCKDVVIGISGGLDSTLALLVTVKAFDMLGLGRKGIHAVTMPCFGTTDRTYQNALTLTGELGAALKEVPVHEAVELHFQQIGHDKDVHDVTYENAQARQRTLVLMDLANEYNGMVIGTGDLSELALGWATYNGDHMSMYGVNSSVPKTLVRYLVSYYAETAESETLRTALLDVLNTPVSPELLPPKDGEIAQKTEDLVGPYELHDFFLYYMMRFGYTPAKIYRMACYAFAGVYDGMTVKKWLQTFYRRFFSQQFKRSCLPDGPKVGSVALSPRGDWRMPSDASVAMWIKETERL